MGETYSAGSARVCRRRPNGVSNNGYIQGGAFSNLEGLCIRNYCLYISTYYYPGSEYSWITGACVTTTTTTTTTTTSTTTTTTTPAPTTTTTTTTTTSTTTTSTTTTSTTTTSTTTTSTTTTEEPTTTTTSSGGPGPTPKPCWVAQTVYGMDNPKWIEFRNWLFGPDETPRLDTWLQRGYMKYGQAVAKFISNKPVLKWAIRKLMDRAIRKKG